MGRALCALAGGGRERRSKRPSTKRSAGAAAIVPPCGVAQEARPARQTPQHGIAVKKPSDPLSRRLQVENPEDSESDDSDGSSESDIEEHQSTGKQQRGAVILARFSATGSLNWLLCRPRPRVARGKGSRPRPCSSRGREGPRPRWRASRGKTPKIRSQMKLHFKACLQSALTLL